MGNQITVAVTKTDGELFESICVSNNISITNKESNDTCYIYIIDGSVIDLYHLGKEFGSQRAINDYKSIYESL